MLKEGTLMIIVWGRRIITGRMHKEAFWGTENVLHIDLGGGHPSVHI